MRQLLPIPKHNVEIIGCESHGSILDSKVWCNELDALHTVIYLFLNDISLDISLSILNVCVFRLVFGTWCLIRPSHILAETDKNVIDCPHNSKNFPNKFWPRIFRATFEENHRTSYGYRPTMRYVSW